MSKLEKRALMPKLRFKDDKGKEYPGWESLSLDRIATITMGTSPPSVAYNQNQEGLPLIQGNADIKNRKSLPKLYTKVITKECLPNDTLLSIRAPVGEVACSDHHACIGRGIASIRARDSILRQNYLYNYMIWHEPKWKSLSQGSTFESVNSKDVRSLRVNIPSLKEQQKIADCLTSIDDLITAQTQKIDTLKAHKKGLMQQLFPAEGETTPKLRFAEFSGEGEWKRRKLGEIGKVITGKTPSTTNKSLWDGSLQFITPSDINDEKKYQISTERYIKQTKDIRVLPPKSIIYTCIASIGKICISVKPCATNQQINALMPYPSRYDNEYVYYSLLKITPRIKAVQANNILPIINKTEFKKINMSFPCLKEQQKIADCLTSIDDLITAQTEKVDTLKAHKKGLMQQLFPTMDKVGT